MARDDDRNDSKRHDDNERSGNNNRSGEDRDNHRDRDGSRYERSERDKKFDRESSRHERSDRDKVNSRYERSDRDRDNLRNERSDRDRDSSRNERSDRDKDNSRYERSDRPDPQYQPYVSNPYGPNNHGDMPAMLPDEGKKEWRSRIRTDMEMRISVWPRSPTPPKQKSKAPLKPVEPIKEKKENKENKESTLMKNIVMKTKPTENNKKSKRRRSMSESSDSSSSSSSESSSSSSSSSDSSSESESDSSSSEDKKKKKSKSKKSSRKVNSKDKKKDDKHKKKVTKTEPTRAEKEKNSELLILKEKSVRFEAEVEERLESEKLGREKKATEEEEIEMQIKNTKAMHDAMGLNEYERAEIEAFRRDVQGIGRKEREEDDESDDDMGPLPMVQPKDYGENKQMTYGGALLPGEGAAIAMYVQQNMRIPRRGEIGWSGEEINGLEGQGYVMSGSRHARMNAVRIRKENQVYSAEEKKALALITFEEKQQKDNKVVGDFRQMLTHKLIASGHITATAEQEREEEAEQ